MTCPTMVLGQLGNKVQHALRAYTPREQKALKMAAELFRPNPAFETQRAIQEVGTGEAVVSLLEAKAVPSIVQRTLIRPPVSQMGPITGDERASVIGASPVGTRYDSALDRESAFEILRAKADASSRSAEESQDQAEDEFKTGRRYSPEDDKPKAKPKSRSDSLATTAAKTGVRWLGSRDGQRVIRGVLGGLFGKK